jgi:hypothetical protein
MGSAGHGASVQVCDCTVRPTQSTPHQPLLYMRARRVGTHRHCNNSPTGCCSTRRSGRHYSHRSCSSWGGTWRHTAGRGTGHYLGAQRWLTLRRLSKRQGAAPPQRPSWPPDSPPQSWSSPPGRKGVGDTAVCDFAPELTRPRPSARTVHLVRFLVPEQ